MERWVFVVRCTLKTKISLLTSQQSTAPPQTFSMPVTVQSSNQSTLQFSNPGNALVTTSYVTSSSLTETHLLSPQQPALQRNTVSPGLPQRPASAGERVILCWVWRDWSRQLTDKYQQNQTVKHWPASRWVFGREISDTKKKKKNKECSFKKI